MINLCRIFVWYIMLFLIITYLKFIFMTLIFEFYLYDSNIILLLLQTNEIVVNEVYRIY